MSDPKLYPLSDFAPSAVRKKFGFTSFLSQRTPTKELMAVMTGEKRSPKKGEWYISGALPAGYRAKHDLGMIFHIARLVLVEKKTIQTFTIIDEEEYDTSGQPA
jgi:hypothetical protein